MATGVAVLGASSGKGVAKLAKAHQKTIDGITDACTGFTAAQIGLPTTCPQITSQGAVR